MLIARRGDGSRGKKQAEGEDEFACHQMVDDITAHNEDSAKNSSREAFAENNSTFLALSDGGRKSRLSRDRQPASHGAEENRESRLGK